jgi:hypothetical protein
MVNNKDATTQASAVSPERGKVLFLISFILELFELTEALAVAAHVAAKSRGIVPQVEFVL